jgi:TonB family protein
MNHTLGVNVFRLGNQFNHSLTLNRFKMMKKPKKSPLGIVKLAFLVPLLLLVMALSTGMSPQKEYVVKGKVVFADGGEAAPGTSIVIANSTVGTVADRDGSFQLKVEGNPDIVFSFVGYRTLRIPASDIKARKPVQLEQRTFTVDLKDTQTGNLSWSASNSMVVNSESEEEPVIVLNGEVVLTMENIDPESIEKIEVIKDPDSPLLEKYDAEDGVILIASKEENGTIVSGDEVFYIVEDMPMFPGGRAALKSYIYSKLEHPDAMKGNTGEVQVQFLVSGSGALKDIRAFQSTDAAFEEPALDVFRSMPNWNPGKQRGKPVAVQVVVPVRFDPKMN